MKWGLFSRVMVSLGSVLLISMLGLAYLFIQNTDKQLSGHQLAQVKVKVLELAISAGAATQQNTDEILTPQLKILLSEEGSRLNIAYAVLTDSTGKIIAASHPGIEIPSGPVSGLSTEQPFHVRAIDYQGRPATELVYTVADTTMGVNVMGATAGQIARVHVAYYEANDGDAYATYRNRIIEIAPTMGGVWLLSMFVIMIALSRSIKPLTALTERITSTSIDNPHRVISRDLRSRKDEVGILACAFDAMIANVQKSYSEVEKREAHYRQLVETANVIPWELDLNSRRISYVGPQITSILGYSIEEWCQEKFWFNHVCLEDKQMAEDFYRRVATDEDEKEIEYRMLHANGSVVWVRDWVHKSSNNPRSPVLQGFMFDVSERVNTRHELQRYREHLENVVNERTAELLTVNQELQSFAHSLSQDLRVPLRIINGFSQAMLEDYADVVDEDGRKNLQRICHGAEKMGKMIDDILILSRVTRQDIRRHNISLSEMAAKVTAQLSLENGGVEVEISEDITAYADPELLVIVLDHLLRNAWKFSAKKTQPVVSFTSRTIDEKTIYSVKDNGAGFDMQYVDKLFLPFKRLHNSDEFEGTGIGLATVKRIILRHGGDVWGEGIVGEGATLNFTLSKSSEEMALSED